MRSLSLAASATTPGATPASTARSNTWSTPLATTIVPSLVSAPRRMIPRSGAEFLGAQSGQQDAADVKQALEGAAIGGCFAQGHGVGGAADGTLVVDEAGAIVGNRGGEVAAFARGAGEDEGTCHASSMRPRFEVSQVKY